MNYRHSFHAGNFADVFKHTILARITAYLLQKPSTFRYIDTHAGVGIYDLWGETAARTGEWKNGIELLFNAEFPSPICDFFVPYLSTIAALNPNGELRYYPGSPEIVRALMRPHDRAALCELHKDDAAHLRWRYARDERVKVCELDGWTGLNAFIPPKERRGLVLIDPPFEEPGEFERMNDALASGIRKWATGIFLLWYPIKHISDTNAFAEQLSHNGISKIMRAELYIHEPVSSNRLNGNGLIIVNPPWLLEAELRVVLPALAALLQKSSRGGWKIDQITN